MGNLISRQTSTAGQDVAATDVQVEGVPAVSQEAAEQVERIDEKLQQEANEEDLTEATDSGGGVPTDLADIMAQGLHEEEDVQSLPTLQSALQDLKAKHGINMEASQTDDAFKTNEIADQEARLRALLKNKKRPAPKPEPESSSSSESESDSSDDNSSSGSSSSSGSEPKASSKAKPAKRVKLQDEVVDMDEGSDDDDDDDLGPRGVGGALRTDHEEPEPPVELPPIPAFPPEAGELNLLGHVHNKVGNVAVIQAAFHSESDVLDSGTLVGLTDRTVIGSIFETFGPLAKPYFSVRFPSDQSPALTALELRQPVVFCPANPNYATLLKTLDVRALGKGSDASNVFDEEPAAHEMEFSDDEVEQAYKRSQKKARQEYHRESAPHQDQPQPQQHQPGVYAGRSKEPISTDTQDLPYDDDDQAPATPASAASDSRQPPRGAESGPERGVRGRGRGRDRRSAREGGGGRGGAREPRGGGRGRDRGGRGGRGREHAYRDRDPRGDSYHPPPPSSVHPQAHRYSYPPQGMPMPLPPQIPGGPMPPRSSASTAGGSSPASWQHDYPSPATYMSSGPRARGSQDYGRPMPPMPLPTGGMPSSWAPSPASASGAAPPWAAGMPSVPAGYSPLSASQPPSSSSTSSLSRPVPSYLAGLDASGPGSGSGGHRSQYDPNAPGRYPYVP